MLKYGGKGAIVRGIGVYIAHGGRSISPAIFGRKYACIANVAGHSA